MRNYIKRIIGFMTTMILAFSFNVSAYSSDNVIDKLNYLTNEQVTSLQNAIDDVKHSENLDLVVVITDDVEGKSSRDYADDYYDYNGYGIDSKYSGSLLLINMEDREAWISTTGKAIDILTDAKIDNILDDVTERLIDQDYYGASQCFIKSVDKYASNYVSNPLLAKIVNSFKSILTYIISAVITALIMAKLLLHDIFGRKNITQDTYLAKNSFRLITQNDTYIRSNTSRVRKQTSSSSSSSSSSSRSSTHRSSSGRTHGGGGRKF